MTILVNIIFYYSFGELNVTFFVDLILASDVVECRCSKDIILYFILLLYIITYVKTSNLNF